jgi:transcriptional regulator with XRE-family HTH domain
MRDDAQAVKTAERQNWRKLLLRLVSAVMTEGERQRLRERRGHWLRLAREAANLNQNEAARLLGLSKTSGTTILAMEKGRRKRVESDVLFALAKVYGVSPRLFLRPPLTDQERLGEYALGALDLEREDWEAEAGDDPDAGDGPSDQPHRRLA